MLEKKIGLVFESARTWKLGFVLVRDLEFEVVLWFVIGLVSP